MSVGSISLGQKNRRLLVLKRTRLFQLQLLQTQSIPILPPRARTPIASTYILPNLDYSERLPIGSAQLQAARSKGDMQYFGNVHNVMSLNRTLPGRPEFDR